VAVGRADQACPDREERGAQPSNLRPKTVIVVDPDIDVHDSDQVEWALANAIDCGSAGHKLGRAGGLKGASEPIVEFNRGAHASEG